MQEAMTHDDPTMYDSNGLLSVLLGGLFTFFMTIFTNPVFHAFLYGFVGAFGGLCCRLLFTVVMKWWNKKKTPKPEI